MPDPYRERQSETPEAKAARWAEIVSDAFTFGPTPRALVTAVARTLDIDRERVRVSQGSTLAHVIVEIDGELSTAATHETRELLAPLLRNHVPAWVLFEFKA